mmetsp:Transcript_4927/g.13257  ORF Transcript_4927/g.13257 Transcript_4927/m.13257 type:complete len:233 (-) Transcript_4927:794-1492(-)
MRCSSGVKIFHAARSSSSRTKAAWFPFKTSSSRRVYASGSLENSSGKRSLYERSSSVVTGSPLSPGVFMFILRYTASLGCMRITNSLRWIDSFGRLGYIKFAAGGAWNWTRTSTLCSLRALPAFMTNGTPSQRVFRTQNTAVAKVGQFESGGTPSWSRYPGLEPSLEAMYCPRMVSSSFTGSMQSSTLTFSSRTYVSKFSPSSRTGGSIAKIASTCSKWFCMTSRMMPNWSK